MARCEHSGRALDPPAAYRLGSAWAPRAVDDGGGTTYTWRCRCGAIVGVTEDGGTYTAADHEEGGGG